MNFFKTVVMTAAALATTCSMAATDLRESVDAIAAPIHNASDLKTFMASHRGADNPLNALSPAARARLVESLDFRNGGVASYYFADLEAELNLTQAFKILSLFGAQSTITVLKHARVESESDLTLNQWRQVAHPQAGPGGGTLENYACSAPGECYRRNDFACSPQYCTYPH